MKVGNMMSESLVENLLKEITLITSRTKVIKDTLIRTNNRILKKRLKKEYKTLIHRLGEIHITSLNIFKLTKDQICLSGLLVENCKRIKSDIHNNNKELFFT